ncbi:LSU ribosomal protein L4p (L1e) [invertebrate metagenome]|uniref:LSU ribosomal protein L4p (L1e) n=1 Tax=invertebrate metagenome TaxID=1711999 RepID=A0A484H9S2_9ZZZZ
MQVDVISLDNQIVGSVELADEVFAVEVRTDILHRMVRYQLAKRQAGTHKTKGISEISGTTRKPFRQKGRGIARQGSLRSPQCRGGAVIFGPVVRSHAHNLQKKVRRLALRCALSSKARAGLLIVVDKLCIPTPKTRLLAKQLTLLGWGSALIIGDMILEENFVRAARNIKHITVLPYRGVNVYDILRHDVLVLTQETAQHLEALLQ